jgi:hypothetical protein
VTTSRTRGDTATARIGDSVRVRSTTGAAGPRIEGTIHEILTCEPATSRAMPLIFSYGSLQQPDVQVSTFGRRLDGRRDELPGYEPSLVGIDDPLVVATLGRTHHANIIRTAMVDSRVPGTAFEITDAELARVDEYERAFMYERVAVVLASGAEAWVYVDASGTHA